MYVRSAWEQRAVVRRPGGRLIFGVYATTRESGSPFGGGFCEFPAHGIAKVEDIGFKFVGHNVCSVAAAAAYGITPRQTIKGTQLAYEWLYMFVFESRQV